MLRLTAASYQAMLSHLNTVYPEEGCGFLAGRNGRVIHHLAITNADHSQTTFTMSAHEQVTAMLAIEEDGLELLAIYHSHPHSAPYPSATDVARAYYPEAVQIIVSLLDPARPLARGFYIQNGRVTPVKLTVEAQSAGA
ncbi:MAG: M67 family metallopeptidase [Anaerolineales bacterium]|nr:M67 family metallopeptidase [Anaerolineales bacterium]